jgi:hypothetical protein
MASAAAGCEVNFLHLVILVAKTYLCYGMNQLFSEVTKGFSGFLVKTVVSASGSRRLSSLYHGNFYFYYPLKLTRAGALAILTGSLPPVCHLLHRFLGSLGI